MNQPTLETQRLILEPYKDSDLSDILAYASHPEVSKYVPKDFQKPGIIMADMATSIKGEPA